MSRVLDVYRDRTLVGKLIQNKAGILSFTYSSDDLKKNGLAISVSMPLIKSPFEGDTVKAFFSGLLPDDRARQKLARLLGVSEKNPFALLEFIGGECAGALSLYPESVMPPPAEINDSEVLDEKKLKVILKLLQQRPLLAGEEGIRLSLAGAQNKLAVGFHDGKVSLIKGTTPTTYILKPAIEDFSDSVYNEFYCMRLANQVGLTVPHVDILSMNDTAFYLVERYDRISDGGQVKRLHQEDFCQALGVLPEMKYEREGGPKFADCQNLIREHSSKPAVDLSQLVERMIFNFLIGNADAHAKNFSFLYKGRRPELAPAYDLLCTAIYPGLSSKMAMKIGGKYDPRDVHLRHWHRLVADTSTAKRNIEKQLTTLIERTNHHAQSLPEELKKQGIHSPVFKKISKIIQERSKLIMDRMG